MEFRFTPLRLGLFVLLIVVFAVLGGFSLPALLMDSGAPTGNAMKAWLLCVAMFLIGSACLTIIDHYAGLVHPVNLRPAYIVLGLILVVTSYLWIDSLRISWKNQLGL